MQEAPTAGSIRINLAAPAELRPVSQISYCQSGGAGAMLNVQCSYTPGIIL
jgi:hypothetical protein